MKQRKRIRLKGYDYSRDGWYYVTIRPQNKKYGFCKIIDDKIELNEIGEIINEQWEWLSEHYDHIEIDEYVIMPDHFHGIIHILPNSEDPGEALEPPNEKRTGRDPSLQSQGRLSLSNIIGAFKTTSSKRIHLFGYNDFKWERSFYDRILRMDEISIKRSYIINNPKKWCQTHDNS